MRLEDRHSSGDEMLVVAGLAAASNLKAVGFGPADHCARSIVWML